MDLTHRFSDPTHSTPSPHTQLFHIQLVPHTHWNPTTYTVLLMINPSPAIKVHTHTHTPVPIHTHTFQAESTQSTILTDSQWASSGYSSYSQGSSETFKHRSTVTWQGREVEHPADPSNHGDNQLDCEREASTENRIKERIRGHVKFCSSGELPLSFEND